MACGPGPPLRGPARLLFGRCLDPNTAGARLLETLPGVGPVRAAAIATGAREAPYRAPRDLLRVSGVGPVTLSRIEPHLDLPGADACGP